MCIAYSNKRHNIENKTKKQGKGQREERIPPCRGMLGIWKTSFELPAVTNCRLRSPDTQNTREFVLFIGSLSISGNYNNSYVFFSLFLKFFLSL